MNALIIDDHSIVLKGLAILLKDIFVGIKIFEAQSLSEAQAEFMENPMDIIIMDLSFPDSDGMKLIDYFVEHNPMVKILVFSMNNENVYAIRAIKAGAKGYVSKTSGYDVLKVAIQKIAQNGLYVSDNVLGGMLQSNLYTPNPLTTHSDDDTPFSQLTARELEVLRLLTAGKGTKDISVLTGLKANTISTFKKRIYQKLAVNNIPELSELAKLYGVA
jgi:DNA-binding NarL/FixJ family response regulator